MSDELSYPDMTPIDPRPIEDMTPDEVATGLAFTYDGATYVAVERETLDDLLHAAAKLRALMRDEADA